MEITQEKASTNASSRPTSAFDCDSAAFDSILGLRALGGMKLRIDSPQPWIAEASRSTNAVVFANRLNEIDFANRRERLVRLLERQQAWYDAAQEAAQAAEQLLLLCEHHQQPWLQSPNHPHASTSGLYSVR